MLDRGKAHTKHNWTEHRHYDGVGGIYDSLHSDQYLYNSASEPRKTAHVPALQLPNQRNKAQTIHLPFNQSICTHGGNFIYISLLLCLSSDSLPHTGKLLAT